MSAAENTNSVQGCMTLRLHGVLRSNIVRKNPSYKRVLWIRENTKEFRGYRVKVCYIQGSQK
jgi:hypothetical protein